MFITELDTWGRSVRAAQNNKTSSHARHHRRSSATTVSSSSDTDQDSHATAVDSLQRSSYRSSSGSGGPGISGQKLYYSNTTSSGSRPSSTQRMGSSSTTITAAADAQRAARASRSLSANGTLREAELSVQSRDMDLAGLDAELRRRSTRLPREGRPATQHDREALSELTAFLRNVTPPPTNYMSLPDPSSPSTLSSLSSLKGAKKQGALKRALGLLMRRGSKRKKVKRRGSVSSKPSSRPGSPASPSRAASVRKKRPARIKLPDTAVAGTTVDGFRHIAISIPIEHAHLGPERRSRTPAWERHGRSKSLSSPETSPRIYDDVKVRPMTAFVTTDVHRGTQLGPLVEERESLSSTSWEKNNSRDAQKDETASKRKVRLASRNTFGTVHEEGSRPNTSSGLPASPPMQQRTSSESSRPHTPRTSDEARANAHRQTLAALVTGSEATSGTPARGGGRQRPVSAYSFRSFTSASPSRIYYPRRNSSLHPSEARSRRARTPSGSGVPHSRDSSRDHTLQESIFSERSYLESIDTMDTSDHPPVLVARRFEGADVVDCPSPRRTSSDSRRNSGSDHASAREKRSSGGSSVRARRKRREAEGPRGTAMVGPSAQPALVLQPTPACEGKDEDDKSQATDVSTAAKSPRQSRFVEDIPDDPLVIRKSKELMRQLNEQKSIRDLARDPEPVGKENGKVANDVVPDESDRDSEPILKAEKLEAQDGTEDTSQVPKRQEVTAEEPDLEVITPSAFPVPPRKGSPKGKAKETSPVQRSRSGSPSRRRSREIPETKPLSPLPSPKERRERRKSTLLSRQERIAELRMALEKPGSQPSDLVLERRLSTSSASSNQSTTPRASKADCKRATFPYAPGTPGLALPSRKSVQAALRVTSIQTVVEVRPCSPELERKNSLALSVSSPATIATMIKTSPVPPYQGFGSVTPPDSPPNSAMSPNSPLSPPDVDNTSLRRRPSVPLKRANSRRSLRSSHGSLRGRRPAPRREDSSPVRPKTAGKGALASNKHFLDPTSPSSRPDFGEGGSNVVGSTRPGEKSVLKMSRSELFDRYEALRDKQTRDLERRIRRLERNGDYWLSSMLPLLTDLSQTLGTLALDRAGESAKGKGKEFDRGERRGGPSRGYGEGRQSRVGVRGTEERPSSGRRPNLEGPGLGRDEVVINHRQPSVQTRASTSSRPRPGRLYLRDDHPDLGYRVETRSFTNDTRSLSLNAMESQDSFRRRRPSSRITPSRDLDPAAPHQQENSASTTLVENGRVKTPMSPGDAERLARLERLNERVAAQMRNLSLASSPPPEIRRKYLQPHDRRHPAGPTKSSLESMSSLETYDDTDASFERPNQGRRRCRSRGHGARDLAYRSSGSGMELVEPVMRELQATGSRLSMESLDSGDVGDDEVRRMRRGPGPRSVVGFGAFSM